MLKRYTTYPPVALSNGMKHFLIIESRRSFGDPGVRGGWLFRAEANSVRAPKRNQNSISAAMRVGREFKGALVVMEATLSASVAAGVLML